MAKQMTPRQFLEKCDIVLTYLNSFPRNSGPDTSEWKQFLTNNDLAAQDSEIRNYMMNERGHIEKMKSPMINDKGREFRRKTTYVEEYDKEYKKNEIEDIEQQDKPYKILRDKRTYFIGLFLLIATVIGILKC